MIALHMQSDFVPVGPYCEKEADYARHKMIEMFFRIRISQI
jgi:hypothetical protein